MWARGVEAGRSRPWDRFLGLTRLGVAACALAFVAAFVGAALARFGYPFELEWMEGAMVDHVRRILAGQALYVPPSLDFVPFLYAPLYYYVAAGVATVIGPGFAALRLVSLVSSLGVLWLLFAIVRRETESPVAGCIAAGLYAACYKRSEAFYDVARVDALAVLLLVATVFVLRFHPSSRGRLVAAVLFLLAFLTKQSALLALPPLLLAALLVGGLRRAAPFLVGAPVLVGASVLALDWIHGGWFVYYVFRIPAAHGIVPEFASRFWLDDLLGPFWVAILVALSYVVYAVCVAIAGRKPLPDVAKARLLYALGAAGALAMSYSGRLHVGGWRNTLMPAYAFLALLFGLGAGTAISFARARSADARSSDARSSEARSSEARSPSRRAAAVELLVLAAVVVQLVKLHYDPRWLVPDRADVAAGRELLQIVGSIEGEVFLPAEGFLPALAGKRTFAHQVAMDDVLRGGEGDVRDQLEAELRAAIAGHRFAAILPDNGWFLSEVRDAYDKELDLWVGRGGVLKCRSGLRLRPHGVYVPCAGAAPERVEGSSRGSD